MSFIPEEELRPKATLNLAPMIDFLFLILMFFATLAVTRITTKDTHIDLVEIKPSIENSSVTGNKELKIVNITIDSEGKYKWVTEMRDHSLDSALAIREELETQYQKGLLPEDKSKTQVLFKIDRKTPWEPILQALFAVRDAGFDVRPVYQPEEA